MNNNRLPEFLSIKEFCQVSGLSQFYIRRRVRAGTLPAIRSGASYFVNVAAALEVLRQESGETGGRTDAGKDG